MKTVLAEIDENGEPIRIFKFTKHAYQLPADRYKEFTKAEAVESIRLKVFARAGCTPTCAGNCEACGRSIIWKTGHYSSGEMHEVIPKGKMVFNGPEGEVSVANSIAICRRCHTGPEGAHGNRRWHTAKKEQNNV